MKIKSIQTFLIALFLSLVFNACTPGGGSDEDALNQTCDALALLNAQSFTPVTKGGEINLSADYLEGAFYHWSGPNNFDANGRTPTVTSSAYYNHRGLYYVTISRDGCPDRVDDVYVDVKFPQGTPSCALINNRATFSGAVSLGTQNFGFMTFGAAQVGDNYQVVANSSNGDMSMYMSPYWKTHDFEDGIYYTTTDPSPDYSDFDKIFISDVNGSIYWACEANKPVYVSHVGGKVRISFCSISFSGSTGGPSYTTIISAQLTQP